MENKNVEHPILVPSIPNFSSQEFLWLRRDSTEMVARAHIEISLLHLHDCWMILTRIVEVA